MIFKSPLLWNTTRMFLNKVEIIYYCCCRCCYCKNFIAHTYVHAYIFTMYIYTQATLLNASLHFWHICSILFLLLFSLFFIFLFLLFSLLLLLHESYKSLLWPFIRRLFSQIWEVGYLHAGIHTHTYNICTCKLLYFSFPYIHTCNIYVRMLICVNVCMYVCM